MPYTTSKEADRKIEEDLEIIKKIIFKSLNPIAIIMFGGFGHGGGSFKKKGKRIIPLNDYDIYLITRKKIGDENLEELGRICSREIGRGGIEFVEEFEKKYNEKDFFHVDLHCIPYAKLGSLYPTQRTFDLKTSKVVYGNKDILAKIPDVKISKSDAFRNLFNKIDHFSIAEGNSRMIKSIYAVKGFTDLCSALLIFYNKYASRYQDKEKEFQKMNVPKELKELVKKAIHAKLYDGYYIKDVNAFFEKSKKWVLWTLKKLMREYLSINENDWKSICREAYKKLPYVYFEDYLGKKIFFPAQYYLNIRFFIESLRKKEFSVKSLLRWRDTGLVIAISLILYFAGEKQEAEKYLKKITSKVCPLRERILKIYSIYYLQKLV